MFLVCFFFTWKRRFLPSWLFAESWVNTLWLMVHWRRFCVILNCCSTTCEFKKKNQTYFIRLPFPNTSMNSLPDMIEETCKVTWRCQSPGCSLFPQKIRIRSVLCDTHWGPHNVLTLETLSLKQGYSDAGMQRDSLSTIVQHRKIRKQKPTMLFPPRKSWNR